MILRHKYAWPHTVNLNMHYSFIDAITPPGGTLSVVKHAPSGQCTHENVLEELKYIDVSNNAVIQLGVTTYLQYTL